MSGPTYVTQDEAAQLCQKSYDTIRRHRRNNALPNSRTRPDGTIEVAVGDLVAAGLFDPFAAGGDVGEVVSCSRIERDLLAARQELAIERTKTEALHARLEHSRAEIEFLRSMLSATKGA